MSCGNVEQLIWSGPGSTLRYVEREASKQVGRVYSSTDDLVDKANIILEATLFQTADRKLL